MGAVVMDHAVIGEGAIVAAGSVVLSKTIVEPGSIYAGGLQRRRALKTCHSEFHRITGAASL